MNDREQEALWYVSTSPIEVQRELNELANRCDSSKEFVRSIMTGNCPKCGSDKTCDGDDLDPEGGDCCQCICQSCGYTWCSECGQEYPCNHWAICDEWEQETEDGIEEEPNAD